MAKPPCVILTRRVTWNSSILSREGDPTNGRLTPFGKPFVKELLEGGTIGEGGLGGGGGMSLVGGLAGTAAPSTGTAGRESKCEEATKVAPDAEAKSKMKKVLADGAEALPRAETEAWRRESGP